MYLKVQVCHHNLAQHRLQQNTQQVRDDSSFHIISKTLKYEYKIISHESGVSIATYEYQPKATERKFFLTIL